MNRLHALADACPFSCLFALQLTKYLAVCVQARVSPSTGTPRNATFITMGTAGLLALVFDIEVRAGVVLELEWV
jgi:hypothetical protein